MGDEVRQIPGYYYDQEKKKYFKITKGTGNTAYSSRDVKRRKVKDENAQEAAATFAKEKDRIRRSKILVSASAGGFLRRSYGHSRLDLVPEIFASKLVQQPEAPWIEEVRMGRSHFGGIINPIFDIQHRGDIGPSTSDCHLGFRNMMVSVRFNAEDVPDDCSQYVKNISQVNTVLFHGMFTVAAPSSSVSVNVSKGFVLSTWLASRFNSGIAMSYIEPGPDGQSNFASAGPTIQMGPGLRRGSEVSIYSSTASPQSSSSLFVVGTSEGIIQVANREPNWLTPKQPAPDTDNPSNIPKDVFALEFLRNDPSVLLSGGRRGILNITDLRVPVFDANADIIRHPSSIIHIKQINDHRIIVAGLRSSLCQYDLRFRKHQNYQTATAPYLQYHDYFNETLWPLGFDVDIDAGIVAAAQQSKAGVATGGSLGGPIHLYSLRTGKLLRKIPTGKTSSTDCNDSGWVQSLRFSQDNDGSSRSSLYFGSSEFAGLNRYGWPDLEDDA